MTHRIVITKDHFNILVDDLVEQIVEYCRNNYHVPSHVYGIPRGGLVPAAALADKLGFKKLDLFEEVIDNVSRGYKVIIVDEICDSGTTLFSLYVNTFQQKVPNLTDEDFNKAIKANLLTAVLIHNTENKCQFEPNFASWKFKRSEMPHWFKFHWENDE